MAAWLDLATELGRGAAVPRDQAGGAGAPDAKAPGGRSRTPFGLGRPRGGAAWRWAAAALVGACLSPPAHIVKK